MRIKLRCPHCGDWFTLSLGVENGDAESRESDEQEEEADADGEPARPRAKASRARLIGAVTVVAAAVIVIWIVAALRSDRGSGAAGPGDVSARPAAVRIATGRDARDESEPSEPASPLPDVSSSRPHEDEIADLGDEAVRLGGDAGVPEDEPTGDSDETAAADRTSGGRDVSPDDADATGRPSVGAEAPSARAGDAVALSTEAEAPEAAVPEAVEKEILELEIEAVRRCWILVKADGVVVADATLDQGEHRSWRADGFFELNLGAGDAIRLSLNGSDLGSAGPDARVVEGLRITRDGIRGR